MRGEWLLMGITLLGGCDACSTVVAVMKEQTQSPDESTGHELVRERLKSAKEIAKKLCGLESADGLKVDTISGDSTLGIGTLEITAEPIASPDAGIDPKRAIACAGVLMVSFKAVTTDDDGNVTQWAVSSMEIDEIKTPGHEWKRPVEISD